MFGPLVAIGEARPFASETVRLAIIAGLLLLWLVWLILAQRRAIRANRLFVAELATPEPKRATTPPPKASPRSAPASRRCSPS